MLLFLFKHGMLARAPLLWHQKPKSILEVTSCSVCLIYNEGWVPKTLAQS